MADYYVYALLDPRKPRADLACFGTKTCLKFLPRYIGKGRGGRLRGTVHLSINPSTTPKGRWLRRLAAEGIEPVIKIIKAHLPEDKAFELERSLIKHFGRKAIGTGCLFNQSGGGEGGNHTTKEVIDAYRKKLKGSGLTLTGKFWNRTEYTAHRCKKHGEVQTAPMHVLTRLANGRPACPKCGIKARGPKMREHRLLTGEESYAELLKPLRKKYRMIGEYTGAIKLTTHWCSVHGKFEITPANVRQKLTQGMTPCVKCNVPLHKEVDRWASRRQKMYDDYKKLLKGKYRLLETDPAMITQGKIMHHCKNHGEFNNAPGIVRANLTKGNTPCPHCNIEIRNANNWKSAPLGGRLKS